MNWKTIDENWHRFSYENQIDLTKRMRSYFYGTLTIYKAKEQFGGFEIVYINKLNKSAVMASSYRIGNKIVLYTIFAVKQDLKLRITRNSFCKRLKSGSDRLNIKSNIAHIESILPILHIKELIALFPDLRIEIKKFDQHQNEDISLGQPIILICSKHQPLKLEHLNLLRELMRSILNILKQQGYISPTISHTQ